MSAAVCGTKRSFFEDLPPSPPVSKRLRCSSSPIRLSLPSLIDHLQSLFPHMEDQIIERALQECGNDLDAAIKSLHGLCLGSADENSVIAPNPDAAVETGVFEGNGDASASGSQAAENNLPADGPEWIELFVSEMSCATSVDDARARAAKLLEVLEKSISANVSSGAMTDLQRENLMLKYQVEVLTKERNCFKSAFRIQLERLSDYEDKDRELQQLKQLVSQYQEQIRTLEVNNYALRMHLNQAQKYNPFPGGFPPDAF
ncbi:Ubiquitin system component Cue protein [Trifolium repens]|nr:Ubiquitin system component Cue protein [Trifolium repens]